MCPSVAADVSRLFIGTLRLAYHVLKGYPFAADVRRLIVRTLPLASHVLPLCLCAADVSSLQPKPTQRKHNAWVPPVGPTPPTHQPTHPPPVIAHLTQPSITPDNQYLAAGVFSSLGHLIQWPYQVALLNARTSQALSGRQGGEGDPSSAVKQLFRVTPTACRATNAAQAPTHAWFAWFSPAFDRFDSRFKRGDFHQLDPSQLVNFQPFLGPCSGNVPSLISPNERRRPTDETNNFTC